MRTTAPIMLVFTIAVAGAMLVGSGFFQAWGAEPPQTQAAQDKLEESAREANPNASPISGPVSSGESQIIGLIVSAAKTLVNLGGAVALLPMTLMELGFPAWAALPIGSFAYLLAGIGVIEFVVNREWT